MSDPSKLAPQASASEAPAPEAPAPEAGEAPKGSPDASAKTGGGRVVIKKYANRRLYNTAFSAYVTLEHLAEMVRQGTDFVVFDAKTNDDITRQVLTQIIFEEESRGQNLLPVQFLRQLIQLYGDQMQSFVPSYLEASLDAFARQHERFRDQFAGATAVTPGLGLWEEQVRSNLALFDRAMKMFTPPVPSRGPEPAPPPPPPSAAPPRADDLSDLKRSMEEMQAQIARLASKA